MLLNRGCRAVEDNWSLEIKERSSADSACLTPFEDEAVHPGPSEVLLQHQHNEH